MRSRPAVFLHKAAWAAFAVASTAFASAQGTGPVRLDPSADPESQGLSLWDRGESSRKHSQVSRRACVSTDIATKAFYLDLRTVPDFPLVDWDTLRVTVDYFDNGEGPVLLQYSSSSPMTPQRDYPFRLAAPLWRGDSGTWRTATWQLTDPRFRQPGAPLEFRLYAEGWLSPSRELYVGSVVVDHASIVITPVTDVLPAGGQNACKLMIQASDASGNAWPDGSTLSLLSTAGSVTPNVQTVGGEARVTFSPGQKPGTTWVTAEGLGIRQAIPIFILDTDREIATREAVYGAAELARGASIVESNAGDQSISVVQEGPDTLLRVSASFPENSQGSPALSLQVPVALPGVPRQLRLALGSGVHVSGLSLYCRDGSGECFLYNVVPHGAWGVAKTDELVLPVGCAALSWGGNQDFVPDPPFSLDHLRVWFDQGTTEGSLTIRSVGATVDAPAAEE